jgi:ApaG protein
METLITSGIEVNVSTLYQPAHSSPAQGEFMHTYHITLHNHNLFPVQLLRRRWLITDGFGQTQIVEGDGVVGRQPVIYPADSYQYVSGCHLNSGIGKMEGTYTFVNKLSRAEFEVTIPVFKLEATTILN